MEQHNEQYKNSREGGIITIPVTSTRGKYNVLIGTQSGSWIVDEINSHFRGNKIVVVSDANVAPIHGEPLATALHSPNRFVSLHCVPAGEGSKSFAQAERLCGVLLESGFSRGDLLVAVGGGVVGDLTGFVASVLLRGIDYIHVPTTTLAAVDSSVGGKTAINTPHGKNLVGTFYPPNAVVIALSHLFTQPQRMHCSGLAEVVKIAVTRDANFFNYLETKVGEVTAFEPLVLTEILRRSIMLKRDIVVADETEQGLRKVLNFGHTLGHAIEVGEGFTLLHGEAVAIGMLAELEWFTECVEEAKDGLEDVIFSQHGEELKLRLAHLLRALSLGVDWQSAHYDREVLQLDKKRVATILEIPVATAIGRYRSIETSVESLSDFIERRVN